MENKSLQSPFVLRTGSFLLYAPRFILGSEKIGLAVVGGDVTCVKGFFESPGCFQRFPGVGRGCVMR